jgi:hypothetical protein
MRLAAITMNSPRQLNVQLFESLEILEVLAGDSLERNVVDVDFVLFDQVQQQIERSFKDLELNLVIDVHVCAARLYRQARAKVNRFGVPAMAAVAL